MPQTFFVSSLQYLRIGTFSNFVGSKTLLKNGWKIVSPCQQKVVLPLVPYGQRIPWRVTTQCVAKYSSDSIDKKETYLPEPTGQQGTFDYRVFIVKNQKRISPWHDIALFFDEKQKILNFVNEIPKGESGKFEIATKEALNPIKQDVKNGALRFYKYGPSLINYGALPQTWEDPEIKDPVTTFGGDNDPLDVLEIGTEVLVTGGVYQVKVLGALALIDGEETDWKIFAIRVHDKLAERVHHLEDYEALFPGSLEKVKDWFRLYKTAEGKGENRYGYEGRFLDKERALQVIEECHAAWKKLRANAFHKELAI
eukprot:jgi/Galph1/3244/GphlegSOOS_G1907.1